jgi:hypothetical protein
MERLSTIPKNTLHRGEETLLMMLTTENTVLQNLKKEDTMVT